MKRLLIIAAIIAAAASATAQTADTTMARCASVRDVNAQFERINRGVNMHAAMVGVGGGMQVVGLLIMAKGYKDAMYDASHGNIGGADNGGMDLTEIGMYITATGAAFIAASFLPLPKRVTVDGNGVSVRIHD